MKLTRLELLAPDIEAQADFYAKKLDLPVQRDQTDQIKVQAGETELVFKQAEPSWRGVYHLAFNIPEKQIEANRRNAKKSTGPRSAEGKAASSRNALKSGLYAREITLVKEQSYELERLEKQFTLEYCPLTPTERALVDTLAHLE